MAGFAGGDLDPWLIALVPRKPRHVYWRRRIVVLLVPVALVLGVLTVVRSQGRPAEATAGASNREDGRPLDLDVSIPPPVDRAAPSVPLEPDPVVPPAASRFQPLGGESLLDRAPLSPGVAAVVDVPGRAGVAASGISAVAVQVMAASSGDPGVVTVWPDGAVPPAVPTLTVAGNGDTAVTWTVVPLPESGRILVSATQTAEVTVRAVGAFSPSAEGTTSGRFVAVDPPVRLHDGDLDVTATTPLDLLDAIGTAPSVAGTALVRVRVTDAAPPGTVTIGDEPVAELPQAGATAATLATVPLGDGEPQPLGVTGGQAVVSVDMVGWFTGSGAPRGTDGLLVPLPPARVLDTTTAGGPLDPGYRRDAGVGGAGGLPEFGAAAVLARVGVPAPADGGDVWVWPGGQRRPPTPVLPVRSGPDTATVDLLRLGQGGRLSIRSDAAVDVQVDVLGYLVGRALPPDPLVAPVAPGPAGAEPLPELDAVVERFLRQRGIPGASLAVARDGRIVYARAYGTADPATGAPVRLDTRFRLASISKVVTAAAVLRLVAEGALSLDEPVLARIGARLPAPADGRLTTVTARQLLHHTSGLATAPDPFFNEAGDAFAPGGPRSCEEAARWLVGRSLRSEPGSRFDYSNGGFCLLSLLVEAVTGSSYEAAVQSLVLEPRGAVRIGPGRTTFTEPGDAAHPTADPLGPGVGFFMESLLGAGGLLGTPTDVVRVVDGLDPTRSGPGSAAPDRPALLDSAGFSDLLLPGPSRWGLGVDVLGPGAFGHTGSLAGARSMTVHQADGTTWAITVNAAFGDHGSVLGSLMARALAAVPAWPAWDLAPDLP
jgi:D-alanyl-D-alanine carboxypeptidase